ncbi:unnamed protein product [Haemonchus placei]|uniref:CCHC-type domain-containing protein n=1 Tax=Haemonchus placei TaxID=6290 RepID=A0A0N4W8K1_HAEPC|nr:unnamed protein product [Haemonchus placei]
MGPPVTRSQSTESRAVVALTPRPDSDWPASANLAGALADLNDRATVRGRDAKNLRYATVLAIGEVREEARAGATRLAQTINEGNSGLLSDLNNSFAAVGERIDSLPLVATVNPDGPLPRIVPFSGSGEDPLQFSLWLRRLEDIMRMRSTTWTSQQKAFFLTGFLDGLARGKAEELTDDEREEYSSVVAHLKKSFEGPQHRYMARQALSSCQQQTGESASTFANKLLLLVRAATYGQDPASQKDGVLEEFVARLRPDIRYYVKLDNPSTFEQAVAKAQMVEQLLAEATADRLIRPSLPTQAIEVKAAAPPQQSSRNYERRRSPFNRGQAHFSQQPRGRLPTRPVRAEATTNCFNCGGVGLFSRQCPSPRVTRRAPGKSSFRSLSNDGNFSRFSPRDGIPPSRYDRDRELSQARDQIRALSISLQENQSALERSDARVNALVKRKRS